MMSFDNMKRCSVVVKETFSTRLIPPVPVHTEPLWRGVAERIQCRLRVECIRSAQHYLIVSFGLALSPNCPNWNKPLLDWMQSGWS